ncbi:MAG: response regulator [Mariprofundaceae bacterium]|nr:response regulator [Mariprofundaceae bacterium]
MKILIAEDFEDTRMILRAMMENSGYIVTCANNGREALAQARADMPDLIISDILMPEMDGFDLCRAIKTDETLRHIPFIFYTATYIEDADRELAMAAGASRFIIKPVDSQTFLANVQEELDAYYEQRMQVPEAPLKGDDELELMHERALSRKLDEKVWQLERERRALVLSETKYRTLFEASGDAIILLDEQVFIDCNPAALTMFGCSTRDDFLGKHPAAWSPRLQPGDIQSQQLADEHISRALAQGSNRFEWLHRRLDDSEFPAEVSLTTMELDGNTVLQAIVRDISERKSYEDQLRKLSCCVEQSGEAILITDRQGTIEYVNPSFTRLTGYLSQEAIGQNPNILNSGNHDSAFYQQMWQTITAGRAWQGKVIDRRKDGSFYPSFLTISPIHDQSDSDAPFTHFVGIQSDLTQIEDVEARFQQAQKMEAVGTLVGGIAHDFNNVLAGITGNIYLAKAVVHTVPEAISMLDDAEALGFRAADMISRLLAFSRKSAISMKAIPLTAYLKETMKLLSVSVPESIRLDLHICSDDMQVYGDSTQIHQMLMNLINNASDALEDVESPTISISLEAFTADEAFVSERTYHINGRDFALISVSDNGCGVQADQIGHLFEPFFTTKELGKGTGLGLAMVYGAVKSHHGFVEVESDPGKGTRFHVYLPILATQAVADVKQSRSPVDGKGECILLVDDEKTILEVNRDVLIRLGYKVLTAANGQEAVALFNAQAESIDLVILDVIMPVMGGLSAYHQMRRIAPDIRVLFSTGYDREQSLADIANEDILSKPISIAEMSHAIRRKLDE